MEEVIVKFDNKEDKETFLRWMQDNVYYLLDHIVENQGFDSDDGNHGYTYDIDSENSIINITKEEE